VPITIIQCSQHKPILTNLTTARWEDGSYSSRIDSTLHLDQQQLEIVNELPIYLGLNPTWNRRNNRINVAFVISTEVILTDSSDTLNLGHVSPLLRTTVTICHRPGVRSLNASPPGGGCKFVKVRFTSTVFLVSSAESIP